VDKITSKNHFIFQKNYMANFENQLLSLIYAIEIRKINIQQMIDRMTWKGFKLERRILFVV